VTAIAGVCIWRSVAYLYLGAGSAYVYNAFETRFDSLAIGCLLATMGQEPLVTRALDRMARYWWLPLVVVGLVAVSRTAAPAYHYSVGFTIDALLMAVFLSQMIRLSATPQWRWLESSPARLLGALSYSLYLYHLWGLSIGKHFGGVLPGLVVTLALAAGSYYVVEGPFLRMKERWSRQSRGRSAWLSTTASA
jgi:peptidoglycan/LPS O-acetylase OafA/YrhL